MCRTRCSLALIALSIGLVHSWDIAITTGDQVEFYTNKTKTNNVGTQFKDLTALAYDAVQNMLLFVDKQNDNASIFSYHIETKKYLSLVRRRSFENIQGIAFDPVTSMLFWTDTSERSIYWMSLKLGSKNGPYGNLLIKMDKESPRAIAVDSCRGYIYWTNININSPTIERSRFDGSDRKVIVNTDIHMPMSIAIDQHSKKLYWVDDKEGIHYSIESSDLEGKNRYTLLTGTNHQPNSLTVSKDSLYWVDWGFKKIWKLPKNAEKGEAKPEEIMLFENEVPFGVVANYKVQDQTEGITECENLRSISHNLNSTIDESFSVPPDMGLFCVHGYKVEGKLQCKCSPGFTGERCDVSICQNYCFQGDCSIITVGQITSPTCRCPDGFTGDRCEVNLCHGYCLNNGACSLNEEHKPVCNCATDFQGTRCETEKTIATAISVNDSCNCTQFSKQYSPEQNQNTTTSLNVTKSQTYTSEQTTPSQADGEFVMPASCNEGWDSVRDPIIMILGILCGMLCLACAVLITKILQLKKRPRIKKRIIVNKNVTPMTARPDQCEITIENCCNMNICETPCFEPRSTIRPSLLDAKPGKEEKKNLIANMEYPDDY